MLWMTVVLTSYLAAAPDPRLRSFDESNVTLRPGQLALDLTLRRDLDQEQRVPAVAELRGGTRMTGVIARLHGGISRSIEAFVEVPYLQRTADAPDAGSTFTGHGSAALGFNAELDGDPEAGTSWTSSLRLQAPASRAELGSPFPRLNATLQRTWTSDPLAIFVSAGAAHDFARTLDGHAVAPGTSVLYSGGALLTLTDTDALLFSVNGHSTPGVRVDGARVPGTSREPLTATVALNHQLARRSPRSAFLQPALNFGLTPDAPGAGLELRYSVTW